MQDLHTQLDAVGLTLPHLLLPAPHVDLRRFSVIACDQYSAQPEYWQETERTVGSAPSSLRLILPEARLPDADGALTTGAQQAMRRYLEDGVLVEEGESLVFLHRETSSGVRRGLVAALDLERYDYAPGAQSLVRTTEGTVADRLPARVGLRQGAVLEIPHVMVLFDDPENLLMRCLDDSRTQLPCLYDFPLMQGGGRVTGWRVDNPSQLGRIAELLLKLKAVSDGMLYAVGDGNHSLAAAKLFWEQLKPTLPPTAQSRHPARYSMVELVNLHDGALAFEPIHRLLLGVDPAQVQRELGVDAGTPPPLDVLQPMLDGFLAAHPEAKLEYIHGEEDCVRLGGRPGSLAFVLPEFDKHSLFSRVRRHGALARKSFSMGQARDKRYYLESRAIR